MPLAANAVLSADGQALIATSPAGKFGVGPSAGVAAEVFVGFSLCQTSAAPFIEPNAVKVDVGVSSAGGLFTLSQVPLAGTLHVHNTLTGATIAAGGWVLTGNVVSVLGANVPCTFTYTYALTVAQAVALNGNQVPSGYAGSLLGTTGVSQKGRIHTNQFNTAVNWNTATGLSLGANGKVSDQTGLVAIRGYVVQRPSADYPFLGIEFDAL
jgi:hypothetical protein